MNLPMLSVAFYTKNLGQPNWQLIEPISVIDFHVWSAMHSNSTKSWLSSIQVWAPDTGFSNNISSSSIPATVYQYKQPISSTILLSQSTSVELTWKLKWSTRLLEFSSYPLKPASFPPWPPSRDTNNFTPTVIPLLKFRGAALGITFMDTERF